MLSEVAPAGKVADAMAQLTARITGRNAELKTKKSASFLGNLFKK
jgi:Flp pilus assembly CpaE family ATPase